ncbi:RNA-binding cell elongation regulator Jag/EloR [Streptococcus sp. sy004]|uniref:RNA-binding cell elongation regulator Jag/EloR n=1 Tax=Streptococcus sp. sy004 TaxID=2600149 RepID=UPI0011B3794B|nr:RNA-binding cell elongation regulator Jag/EloR [Streptococcus sp. sy004]TWT11051.1 protein jag [Streptococcus sp. sy004]
MVLFTGKTVEEAIEKGLKELNLSRLKARIQVVSREKKGFLGFGKKPAQVEIESISPSQSANVSKNQERDLSQTFGDTRELRKVTSIIKRLEERGELPVESAPIEDLSESKIFSKALLKETLGLDFEQDKQLVESEITDEQVIHEDSEQVGVTEVTESVVEVHDPQKDAVELTESTNEQLNQAIEQVVNYVQTIVDEMDVEADIAVSHQGRRIKLQIDTSEAGRVIGYHGKVLKSLQLLAQNFLHDRYDRQFVVSINVHDYVEHRMETLVDFTQKIANRVLESGEAYTMDPMSNQERKVVHKTISKQEGVTSYSEGSDPNRYVVVTPIN